MRVLWCLFGSSRKELAMGMYGFFPMDLLDDGFEIPDAPPMGPKDENVWCRHLIELRDKVVDENGQVFEDEAHALDVAAYENFRSKFAEAFAYIPYKVAHSLSSQCQKGLNFCDLFQEGFEALHHAMDKIEDRSNRFSTFAETVITRSVYKFLDDHNRVIRVPSYMIHRIFIKSKKENWTDEELLENSGLSYQELSSVINPVKSLHQPIDSDEGDEGSFADTISYNPIDNTRPRMMRTLFEEALNHINSRTADIIRKYHFCGYSLKEIADEQICNADPVELDQISLPDNPHENYEICCTVKKPQKKQNKVVYDEHDRIVYKDVKVRYIYHNGQWCRIGITKERVQQLLKKGLKQLSSNDHVAQIFKEYING